MRDKIEHLIKDLLIIGYGVILVIFFVNIYVWGTSCWTERGWILIGETITFALLLLLGVYWFIRDLRREG